jgi:hypothetical protein
MTRECDGRDGLSQRHVYVWKTTKRTKIEMKIAPGSLVGKHPQTWDAFKDLERSAHADVEDNTPSNVPSNMPSNMPSNAPSNRPDSGNRPDPPGVVAEEP